MVQALQKKMELCFLFCLGEGFFYVKLSNFVFNFNTLETHKLASGVKSRFALMSVCDVEA